MGIVSRHRGAWTLAVYAGCCAAWWASAPALSNAAPPEAAATEDYPLAAGDADEQLRAEGRPAYVEPEISPRAALSRLDAGSRGDPTLEGALSGILERHLELRLDSETFPVGSKWGNKIAVRPKCTPCNGTGQVKLVVGGNCSACSGSGKVKIVVGGKCATCRGSGRIKVVLGPSWARYTEDAGECKVCGGDGRVGGSTELGKCKVCNGSGKTAGSTKLGKCNVCGGDGRLAEKHVNHGLWSKGIVRLDRDLHLTVRDLNYQKIDDVHEVSMRVGLTGQFRGNVKLVHYSYGQMLSEATVEARAKPRVEVTLVVTFRRDPDTGDVTVASRAGSASVNVEGVTIDRISHVGGKSAQYFGDLVVGIYRELTLGLGFRKHCRKAADKIQEIAQKERTFTDPIREKFGISITSSGVSIVGTWKGGGYTLKLEADGSSQLSHGNATENATYNYDPLTNTLTQTFTKTGVVRTASLQFVDANTMVYTTETGLKVTFRR